MKLRNNLLAIVAAILLLCNCGIYSFNGANVEGKTINIHTIDNKAQVIAPTLSPTLTEKVRTRILNQTTLSQVNSTNTDYDISGSITGYDVSVNAIQGTQTASESRLTITVEIAFVNNKDNKKSFTKSFTKFAPFSSNQTLQQVESTLINLICNDLADAVFNDAFVNW
jgi:hypothetical protein